MGICASCLGLNRHLSQDVRPDLTVRHSLSLRLMTAIQIDETDPLLDEQNAGYGATGTDGQVDEQELQREREELDRITNAATE